MSGRAERIAASFEQAVADLAAAIERSTDEQWQAVCADGEWTQGYAAYHAASSITGIATMLRTLADGRAAPSTTAGSWDEINATNAAHASEHAACTRQETLDLIHRAARAAAAMARALTDEQLDRRATMMDGMPEWTVEQFGEMVLIGHVAQHLKSIIDAR